MSSKITEAEVRKMLGWMPRPNFANTVYCQPIIEKEKAKLLYNCEIQKSGDGLYRSFVAVGFYPHTSDTVLTDLNFKTAEDAVKNTVEHIVNDYNATTDSWSEGTIKVLNEVMAATAA